MSSLKFDELYAKLNPRQKEAVETIEGPVMVIAGPGTGKTHVLTLRIANILKETDIPPDAILALTFTESGVHSIRKRVVEIIGSRGYQVHIHTFHSFCNDIIKNYPQEFPRIIGAEHITELDQIRIFEKIISGTKLKNLKPFGNPFYYLKPIISEIKELKRENIDAKTFESNVKMQVKHLETIQDLRYENGKYKGEIKGKYKSLRKKIENNKELVIVYKKYQHYLSLDRLYDYEDMIMEVVRELAKNKDLLLELQEKYQYILADEHQDANNAQNRLLELLSGFFDSPNLFIVGDEKQAIFRFQGASLENFLYFRNKYKKAKLISLSENYRSSQSILDASHSLISKNIVTDKTLRVVLKAKAKIPFQKIIWYEFKKPQDEIVFIAEHVKGRIKKGAAPHGIAILYRDNKDVLPLKSAFEKEGIAVAVHSDSDIFSDEDMGKFLLLLEAANEFGSDIRIIPVLFIDFLKISHLDVYRVIEMSRKGKEKIFDIIRSKQKLKKYGVAEPEKLLGLFETLHHASIYAKNHGLIDSLEFIKDITGFIPHLINSRDSIIKLSLLDSLLSQASLLLERHKNFKLADYIDFLKTLSMHGVTPSAKSLRFQEGAVNLMTAHRSKGLEFDFVYCVGVNDGHWSNKRQIKYFDPWLFGGIGSDATIEDERRLFYVALTRAKKEVVITSAEENEFGNQVLASQFIAEIDPKFITKISPLAQSRYGSSKKTVTPLARSVIQKKYLRELFLEQGLSVSALNNYIKCPWQFFFVNLIRIPKAEERHQLFGTAVHDTLRQFFDDYRKDKIWTKKTVLARFQNNLGRKPLAQSDHDSFLGRGKKALLGYFEFYQGSWQKSILNEYKIGGVFIPIENRGSQTKVLINGKLDKIELLNSGVNVVDYKTGTPKSRGYIEGKIKNADGNYMRQLSFYKLLLDSHEGGKYKMVSGEIDFIEPNKRGVYRREKFFIDEEKANDIKKLIQQISKEILSFSFWDKRCDHSGCQFCRLRDLMMSNN